MQKKTIEIEKGLSKKLKSCGFENKDYELSLNTIANTKDNEFITNLELKFALGYGFEITGEYNKEELNLPTEDAVKYIMKGIINGSKSHYDAITRCPSRRYEFERQINTMNLIIPKLRDGELLETAKMLKEIRQRITRDGSFKAKVYNDKNEEEILEFDTIIYSKIMNDTKHFNELCIALEQYSFLNLTPISKVIEIIDE